MLKRGRVIYDFEFLTETGSVCSAVHCCTVPTKTREEIYRYWKGWLPPMGVSEQKLQTLKELSWGFLEYAQKIEETLLQGLS